MLMTNEKWQKKKSQLIGSIFKIGLSYNSPKVVKLHSTC